jgi:RNA polymerase sigma-70 factor, ECF subfamily
MKRDTLVTAVEPHLPALRAAARRILGDDDAAADAVQEALIALWRSGAAPPHLGRWLIRAVVHRSLHARRASLRRTHWETSAGNATDPCTLCDPARALETAELWEHFERVLAELGAEQRDVLLLRDVEGLEYHEISRRLAVPLGTVRSRLNRARLRLRSRLRTDPELRPRLQPRG